MGKNQQYYVLVSSHFLIYKFIYYITTDISVDQSHNESIDPNKIYIKVDTPICFFPPKCQKFEDTRSEWRAQQQHGGRSEAKTKMEKQGCWRC